MAIRRKKHIWEQQPQALALVNQWVDRSKSLIFSAVSPEADLCRGVPAQFYGTKPGTSYNGGVRSDYPNAAGFRAFAVPADLKSKSKYLLFAVAPWTWRGSRYELSPATYGAGGIVVMRGGYGQTVSLTRCGIDVTDGSLYRPGAYVRCNDPGQSVYESANISSANSGCLAIALLVETGKPPVIYYRTSGGVTKRIVGASNVANAATAFSWMHIGALSTADNTLTGSNGAQEVALAGYLTQSDVSEQMAKAIVESPWSIFRPKTSRRPVSSAAGGSLNASASGNDTASGAGTLAAQVALAGVGVSLAGGVANAAASIPLSAAGLSVSGGSANAQATINISAAGLAQAAGQAGLSASVLLAAAAVAQSSGNATLAAQLAALASGGDTAGGSANLTGGAPGALNASGGDIADGTAVLSITVQLAAAGGDTVAGSAAGNAMSPGQLIASGGAQNSGGGIISVTVLLTADGFIQAMGQGNLAIQMPMAAQTRYTVSRYAGLTTVTKPARSYLTQAMKRNFTVTHAH